MKRLSLLLPILVLPMLSGCSVVNEYTPDYVGVYRIDTAYEKEMNYYWGKETEVSSKTLVAIGTVFVINEDASVLIDYGHGYEEEKGVLHATKDYATISNTFFEDGWKFTIADTKEGRTLNYYYRSRNTGFSYDYTVQHIILKEHIDAVQYSSYVGDYKITTSKSVLSDSDIKPTTITDDDFMSLVNGKIKIKEDKTFELIDSKDGIVSSGALVFENRELTLNITNIEELPQGISMKLSMLNMKIYLSGEKTTFKEIGSKVSILLVGYRDFIPVHSK